MAVALQTSKHWQRQAIGLVPNTSSRKLFTVASQQQRLKYFGHAVDACHTNMREPLRLAGQCQSKSSSNDAIDKQNLLYLCSPME